MFNTLPNLINEIINSDLSKINNRLFISYYDVNNLKHKIKSNFKNRNI